MVYVCFDGIDGSGKNTQRDMLADFLELQGKTVRAVDEPDNGNPIGRLIRKFLKSGEYLESHAALFVADRMVLQTGVIRPALAAGEYVLSARSFMSTLVYQQENWPLDWLFDLHRMLPIKPEFLIVLDMDAEQSLNRARHRAGHAEYYERADIQKRNRERYISVCEDPRLSGLMARNGKICIIDASGDPTEVHQRVLLSLGAIL